MQFLKLQVLIALSIGIVSTADAAPINISAVRSSPGTKIYTLFNVDAQKLRRSIPPLSVDQALIRLSQQLLSNPDTADITPCQVRGDLNATSVGCGNNALRFGTNEFFTYTLETALPALNVTFDDGVGPEYGANFRSPNPGVPGEITGNAVRIHFNQRMAQFGLMIDPGLAPSVNGIQFIVNRQTTPVQPLTAGVPQFVGVEDSDGFTDVTIIPSGAPRAWVADRFSYLPLANF